MVRLDLAIVSRIATKQGIIRGQILVYVQIGSTAFNIQPKGFFIKKRVSMCLF